jgi:hypothetical protein
MFELLFNPSYLLVATAILAGAVVVYFGLSQLRKRLTGAGWVMLLLAATWGISAYFVETPREVATRGTYAFVAAVVAGDTATQTAWLSPEASLFRLNKSGILKAAKLYVPQYGIKSATVLGLTSVEGGETVTVSFRCWADLAPDSKAEQKIPTDWKFTFVKYTHDILIQRIDFLGIGNGTSSDVDRFNTDHFGDRLNPSAPSPTPR